MVNNYKAARIIERILAAIINLIFIVAVSIIICIIILNLFSSDPTSNSLISIPFFGSAILIILAVNALSGVGVIYLAISNVIWKRTLGKK